MIVLSLKKHWLEYGIMNTIYAYTNKWGYASRIADLANFISEWKSSGDNFLALERNINIPYI